MLDNKQKTEVFSVWENLKKEKENAVINGITSVSRNVILLVDGMNTFFRSFTSIPSLNDDGLHTGGLCGFLKSMGYAIKLFKPDRCVIIFDGHGGSLKRRKIYSEYKSRRKTKIRLNRVYEDHIDLNNEEDGLKNQLKRLIMYFQYLPVNVLSLDNVEADDTISYLALDCFKNCKVYIMSADRDFLQLVNDNINVWSPTKKKIYTPIDILNEYGINSNNFIYYRSLSGDKSDNISSIKGCGLKTIIKCFPFLSGSSEIKLDDIYKHSKLNINNYKVYENIIENWKLVERNYSLMQLKDTQLQTFAQLNVNDMLNKSIPKLNKFELIKLMNEDKLFNNIPNFPIWCNECFQKLDNYLVK